jgi:hypothetical protein
MPRSSLSVSVLDTSILSLSADYLLSAFSAFSLLTVAPTTSFSVSFFCSLPLNISSPIFLFFYTPLAMSHVGSSVSCRAVVPIVYQARRIKVRPVGS